MATILKKANTSNMDNLYMVTQGRRKYGITEKKKAELDALTAEVLDAQYQVAQYQAIVTALTDKLAKFNGFLADADANKQVTLSNRNLTDHLVQSVVDLLKNSNTTFTEMGLADKKTNALSEQIKNVVNKLIYSSEVINRVANIIVRKKALDPLISDELVSRITTAGSDANNAVALTLIALKSSFAAQATNMESQSATSLEYYQALDFYSLLTGQTDFIENAPTSLKPTLKDNSLWNLMYYSYENAKKQYNEMHEACKVVTHQLNSAESQLNDATITLQSLQLGLSAGTAAALAS